MTPKLLEDLWLQTARPPLALAPPRPPPPAWPLPILPPPLLRRNHFVCSQIRSNFFQRKKSEIFSGAMFFTDARKMISIMQSFPTVCASNSSFCCGKFRILTQPASGLLSLADHYGTVASLGTWRHLKNSYNGVSLVSWKFVFLSSFFSPHEYFPDSLHTFLGTQELVFFPVVHGIFVYLLFRSEWSGGRKQHSRPEGTGTFFRNISPPLSASVCCAIWYDTLKWIRNIIAENIKYAAKSGGHFPFSPSTLWWRQVDADLFAGTIWWPHSNGIHLNVRSIDWLIECVTSTSNAWLIDRSIDWLIDWLILFPALEWIFHGEFMHEDRGCKWHESIKYIRKQLNRKN